ncbi:RNA polymerase sigma factor RpoE [Rubripirellula tenax]|uniref:RNA polymerase sigma factor RpoE n=1 Tax=Rubripirellula tenax TaxID=2528015 RepID=A0A5C6FCY9_9BACT|nr:sigma-70 family RNA polymerase sigma factor [Rubripirellula tenax]TWU59338.1 RNA polymerase sigma factor RpoE [Rubripirellula tenax]
MDKSAAQDDHPTLSSMLISGVKEMDAESWSRLVNTFGPIVYRWCRTSGIAPSDAPDVVQEVFASVARGIGDFQRQKAEGSFRSWLATITRNRVRDHFRRLAKRAAAEGRATGGAEALDQLHQIRQLHQIQEEDLLDSTICPASIESPLIRQVLASVESEFEATTWQAFWATAVDQQPASTVASTLGLSVASVYQAKSRVLRRLRTRMAELPG